MNQNGAASKHSSQTTTENKLNKLRPTPAYLSPSDLMNPAEFHKSLYSKKYTIDLTNIYWGQELNDSHVFDVYSVFTKHKNTIKARLDMLTFVAQNAEWYKWDCYVYFKMDRLLLDKWVNRMTYWGSWADELSLYALSDMLNVYTFVVTGSKLWTTIHLDMKGTELEMLDLCPMKLVHLGDYKFRKFIPKQHQPSVTTSVVINPVVPLPPTPQIEYFYTGSGINGVKPRKPYCPIKYIYWWS